MKLTFKLKYYIGLLFLHLITNAKSMLTHAGTGRKIHNLKISNVQENVALYWPKGIVIYYFDYVTYDDYIAQRVRRAMNVLETVSCVKFEPTLVKPANESWIHFTNPQGERNCVHEPKFKEDGEINLVLGFDCLKEHEILHTLLHAIGFKDEVSHPQRDQYIRVMWNNIQPEYRFLFRIRPSYERTSQLLVEYDPLSIMHFHDRAFSINGQATVVPLVPGLLISPSDNLSQLDKMRLRLLFDHECNKRQIGDMIDTCKMLLSTNDRPKDSKNSQSEESESGNDSGQVDKADEDGKADEEGEAKILTDNEVGKDDSVNVSISIAPADTENNDDDANDIQGQNATGNQNDTAKPKPGGSDLNKLSYVYDRIDLNLG